MSSDIISRPGDEWTAMQPKAGEPLQTWLETALTRYALGGISLGQVVKFWMQVPPAMPKESQPPAPAGDAFTLPLCPLCSHEPEARDQIHVRCGRTPCALSLVWFTEADWKKLAPAAAQPPAAVTSMAAPPSPDPEK